MVKMPQGDNSLLFELFKVNSFMEKHAIVQNNRIIEVSIFMEIVVWQQFSSARILGIHNLDIFVVKIGLYKRLIAIVVNNDYFSKWIKSSYASYRMVPIFVCFFRIDMPSNNKSIGRHERIL
jgi:hypothetical protein